jgi:hypothetical protein
MARAIAVPRLNFGEEVEQVGLRAVTLAAPGEQDAGGERRVEADDLAPARGSAAPRRAAAAARRLRARQASRPAIAGVGSECGQAWRCRRVGENRGAQLPRMRLLLGDELVAGERRRGADDVEAEGHRQHFEAAQVHLGNRDRNFLLRPSPSRSRAGTPPSSRPWASPLGAQRVEPFAQPGEVVGQPLGEAGIRLQGERRTDEAAGRTSSA